MEKRLTAETVQAAHVKRISTHRPRLRHANCPGYIGMKVIRDVEHGGWHERQASGGSGNENEYQRK